MEKEKKQNTWPTTDPDRPLESIAEDELGRDGFVETIAETIINYNKEESIIIGLYGAWGYGKTTILKFIKEYIDNKKINASEEEKLKFPDIIQFDPWVFANQEQLIERFLEWLIKQLEIISPNIKYKNSINTLTNLLFRIRTLTLFTSKDAIIIISSIIFILGISFKISLDSETFKLIGWILLIFGAVGGLMRDWLGLRIERLRSKISENNKLLDLRDYSAAGIAKDLKDSKLVIIIDEIDRLNKDETKQIFQLAKSTFNFRNLIFILAFDNEKVGELISENNGEILNGNEYIEKIVQLPFPIPRPDRVLFEEFAGRLINETIYFIPKYDFDKDRWNEIYLSGLRSILLSDNNPRKIIRFVNSVKSHLFSLQEKVNPIDFIAIRAIEYFYPELYNYLATQIVLLAPTLESEMRAALEVGSKRDELKRDFNERVFKESRNVVNLIEKLFPSIESKPDNETEEIWLKEKRICSPKNFDTYFTLVMPKAEVEYSEIEKFLNDLESPSDFESALLERINDNTLPNFLSDLSSYIDEISSNNPENLIIALINISEKFPDKYYELFVHPDNAVSLIIRRIINKLDKMQGRTVFESAIDNAEGILIPLLIVDFWDNSKRAGKNYEIEIEENLIDALKRSIVLKLEDFSETGILRKTRRLHIVLDRWYKWTNKKFKVENFIDNATNDKQYLPEFLVHYVEYQIVSSTSEGDYKEYKFNFEDLAKLGTDINKLYNRAQGIEHYVDKNLSKDQLRAARLYRIDFANFKKTGKNPDKYYRDEEIF